MPVRDPVVATEGRGEIDQLGVGVSADHLDVEFLVQGKDGACDAHMTAGHAGNG